MEEKKIDAFRIVSLVLGLFALFVTFFIVSGEIPGLIIGILAIIFGTISIRRYEANGIARAGRILGIVVIIIVIVYLIILTGILFFNA